MSDGAALRLRQRDGQQSRQPEEASGPRRVTTLYLRPAGAIEEENRHAAQRRHRVTWTEDTEDNPTQRVSKCCCVFHKKKLFGESSSDSDSSSSSDSDSNDDDRCLNPAGGNGGAADDGHCCVGSHGEMQDGVAKSHKHRRPKCTRDHCYCGTTFH